MAENLKDNPFAALFGSVKDAEVYKEEHAQKSHSSSTNDETKSKKIDEASETRLLQILLLVSTSDSPAKHPCIHLEDGGPLTVESFDRVLFERLLIEEPLHYLVNSNSSFDYKEEVVGQAEVVCYLFDIYDRCITFEEPQNNYIVAKVMNVVVLNLATALLEPSIYFGQKPDKQLKKLIFQHYSACSTLSRMLKMLLEHMQAENHLINPLFEQVLSEIAQKLGKCWLMGIDWNLVDIIDLYASSPYLAPVLLRLPKAISRNSRASGRHYQLTAIGSLLSISCIPRSIGEPFEFYDNPSKATADVHKSTEQSIRVALKALHQRICVTFLLLLKGPDPRMHVLLLDWIEECLVANSGRAGLWHLQAGELEALSYVSDGFMLNLGAVLLHLSIPIVAGIHQDEDISKCKVLKVDPTYCSPEAAEKKAEITGLHSGDIPQLTCLVPRPEKTSSDDSQHINLPTKYSFSTTCFFLTHRTLHLGVQVLNEKLKKLSQELGRIQREFENIAGQNAPMLDNLRKHMDVKTTKYFTYIAALFEHDSTENLIQFLAATAFWLTQVAIHPKNKATTLTYQEVPVSMLQEQSSTESHHLLRYIPEFMVETFVGTIVTINRYNVESLSFCSDSIFHQYMGFIASFMGSPHFINNPHLRAHMCECLEALLLKQQQSKGIISTNRERVLLNHPLTLHFVTAIIHVFVSIEMTGSSVAFEEKFNYRRPMYDVMKHLWEIKSHQNEFVALANYALAHMESAIPPLFLRFVNLLINDAIFLLDEGLSFMSQLRELEIERDSGKWKELSQNEQREMEQNFDQMSRLARFHNALGDCTIQTLIRLSKEIPKMFTHSTLVDRMAAMLNHFLQNLVGPKQYKLKVRDMDKYEFKPGEIVSNICTIYVHLINEESFGLAVSNDGRSYNPQLFIQASRVLGRIGKVELCDQIQEVGYTISGVSKRQKDFEDLAATAPDNYLDPIMLHLMMDPVILPSSNMIVDRQTIARHLLSDQSDPFNRQALTMEQVIPDETLKAEIRQWLHDQEQERAKQKDLPL